MTDFLDKNLCAMHEGLSALKNNILARKETFAGSSGNVLPFLIEEGGRGYLAASSDEGTYQLESFYDNKKTGEIWGGLLPGKLGYRQKFIFFGLGNGMLVRSVLKRADDTIRILVYEPSATFFMTLLSLIDCSDILSDERVILYADEISPSPKEFLCRFVDYKDLKDLFYQPYPNYKKLFRNRQKEFLDEIQLLHNQVKATQGVMGRYGKRYFKNSLSNLTAFAFGKSLTDLYIKIPKDIPYIVVSSGPSLDKNIEELRNLKGKAFIVCADSALRAVLNKGIIPDMFVTVDGGKDVRHFENPLVSDIPMLTELTANCAVVEKVRADKFFINDFNPQINSFMQSEKLMAPTLSTGGSVANTAYAMAASMGFKTVILVGQDLAYTDNKTHTGDSLRGSWNIDASTLAGFMTDGYYGEKVRTSYEFQIYKDWFEEEIAKNPDVHTINATEGGALIKGAENMPLSEAVRRYCVKEYDLDGMWDSIEYFFTPEVRERFIMYMKKLPGELEMILHEVKNGIRDYDRLFRLTFETGIKQNEVRKLAEKTAAVTEKIEKTPGMYYIQNLMQDVTNEYLSRVYDTNDDVRADIRKMAEDGKDYLEVVKKTLEESLPRIKAAVENISSNNA